MNPKYEVQPTFSSKKPSFSSLRTMNPGEIKYEYHWSDDTAHDFVFLQKVLEDIFADRCIKCETALIKSYIVPIQYKNKCFFKSMQQFNAAGHNKGLIDSTLTFGCNSILRRERCYRKQRSQPVKKYVTISHWEETTVWVIMITRQTTLTSSHATFFFLLRTDPIHIRLKKT